MSRIEEATRLRIRIGLWMRELEGVQQIETKEDMRELEKVVAQVTEQMRQLLEPQPRTPTYTVDLSRVDKGIISVETRGVVVEDPQALVSELMEKRGLEGDWRVTKIHKPGGIQTIEARLPKEMKVGGKSVPVTLESVEAMLAKLPEAQRNAILARIAS